MLLASSLVGLDPPGASGWCSSCGRPHSLPRTAQAEVEALSLLRRIEQSGRFDFTAAEPDPRFGLTQEQRRTGKMLGVLLCSDGTVLRAFSGMLGGTWHCPGWAPPVAGLTLEDAEPAAAFGEIVRLVARADAAAEPERGRLRRAHRERSAALSQALGASYVLRNARGEEAGVLELLRAQGVRPPGGVGDCAAPKLLTEAHRRRLVPEAIAEVWCGPPAKTRTHGSFHAACRERCEPIMGFLLCGVPAACGADG